MDLESVCSHPEDDRYTCGDNGFGCGRCGKTPANLTWDRIRAEHGINWDNVTLPTDLC